MRKTTAMRCAVHRASRLLLAFALVSVLSGCGSTLTGFDPTDLMDFLDTKKRAPGERKPVFPEGVPGISQGVPKEMVRGSPERAAADAQGAASTAPVDTQPAPPPAPAKRTRTAAKRPAAQEQAPVEIAPDDVNVEDETPPASPPPPPRRQAQRRQSAPPPQAEQQGNPFPAPLPR